MKQLEHQYLQDHQIILLNPSLVSNRSYCYQPGACPRGIQPSQVSTHRDAQVVLSGNRLLLGHFGISPILKKSHMKWEISQKSQGDSHFLMHIQNIFWMTEWRFNSNVTSLGAVRTDRIPSQNPGKDSKWHVSPNWLTNKAWLQTTHVRFSLNRPPQTTHTFCWCYMSPTSYHPYNMEFPKATSFLLVT
jgi:hypothetical protein